ncbi:Lysine-specific demethylase 4D [Manis javanica]|nr:Lysine-specific demethylase 4D [Manis javanica]
MTVGSIVTCAVRVSKYQAPPHTDFDDLERKFWKTRLYSSPIYGADVNGSLFAKTPSSGTSDTWEPFRICWSRGVWGGHRRRQQHPTCHFGMWKTTFAWHTEDMDLYSAINYVHLEEPKRHGMQCPRSMASPGTPGQGLFRAGAHSCRGLPLRHKVALISPTVLRDNHLGSPSVGSRRRLASSSDISVHGYHAGFNHGFNCAEAINAMPRMD